MEVRLTPIQEEAYKLISKGYSCFLTGCGGTGKTEIIKTFVKYNKDLKKIGVTSTTGTSALLINGTTLHSFCGIGLGKGTVETLVTKISTYKFIVNRWKTLQVLIIDEVSMLNPDLFDKLEQIARIIRSDPRPFGGIQLILTGDFLQLPTVNSEKFCFQAESWNKCVNKIIYLTEIIRQSDPVFQECLNNIRLGNITTEITNILKSRIGVNLTNDVGIQPTKMFSHNMTVEQINNIELDKLAEDGREFREYEMEFVAYSEKIIDFEKYKKSCNAQEILQLCIGCQVMLLYNMDLVNGLVNGSRGVVINFLNDIPLVKFLNGQERFIDIYTWEIEENNKKIASITQIPLKVAYAISIHRSQGVSLDYAEVDLTNVFEYGQAYVALSRVKTLEGLSIIGMDVNKIRAHPLAVEFYKNLV
jgi:ATP-dependent DNA helicase PIF1